MSASAAGLWYGKGGGSVKCERCMYRARPHAGYQCDYYAITGHTRRAVPAARCRRFREGARLSAAEEDILPPAVRTSPKAARTGKEAKEGAAAPPKEAGSRRMLYDWEKACVLYSQGESDGAISRALGCTSKAVGNWRKRMGLPLNYQQGMQKRKP